MLSYVMPIANEGREFDLSLAALEPVMAAGDELIVCDGGSTDQSLERAAQFRERAAVRLIRLEQPLGSPEALQAVSSEAGGGYLMMLRPTDRLQAEPLAKLRDRLTAEAPDLAVLDSGWWLGDAQLPIPRSDAEQIAGMPEKPNAGSLRGLCPDLGRLVFRRSALQERFAPTLLGSNPTWRHAALIEAAETVIFQKGPVVLHALGEVACEISLRDAALLLKPLRGDAQMVHLKEVLCGMDEVVWLSPPSKAEELLGSARELERVLSRAASRELRNHSGACGRLMAALHGGGRSEAMALLALLAAEQSHFFVNHLNNVYTRLRQDLDLALPGPTYLMDLYNRVRSL